MDAARARVVLAAWAALAAAAMVLLSPWTGAGDAGGRGPGVSVLCDHRQAAVRRGTGDLAGFFLQLCELGMVLGAIAAQRMEVLV